MNIPTWAINVLVMALVLAGTLYVVPHFLQ
ncbi:hypothetical protein ALO68_200124 [Pseudomonas syringae pv. helianthi]|uniref:Conjugal transfer protein TraR n=1 Tax=Pseudomonas syringae pv. helianthi TaxID=251654 RepID=A0A0N8RNZ3_9PSED|nr:hypothetical protein ALO68_200124 [Pseudomonas syringae pv. helianthi]